MNVFTRQNSFWPSSVALESAKAPEEGPATPSGADLGTQRRRKPSTRSRSKRRPCQSGWSTLAAGGSNRPSPAEASTSSASQVKRSALIASAHEIRRLTLWAPTDDIDGGRVPTQGRQELCARRRRTRRRARGTGGGGGSARRRHVRDVGVDEPELAREITGTRAGCQSRVESQRDGEVAPR
jgi:hypothetical protein